MSTGDPIVFDPSGYDAGRAADVPPPVITPDMIPPGMSPYDAALWALQYVTNLGDAERNAEHQGDHANRQAKYDDALTKFPANEEQSAAQMNGVGAEVQLAQMIPQMASGVAGALTGAIGGIMGPLTQIPQQLMQAGTQAMQTGMGAMQQAGGQDSLSDEELLGADGLLSDELGGSAGEVGGGGAGGGGGSGLGDTAPSALLGPIVPTASTFPSAAPPMAPIAPPATAAPSHTPMGGMGGMPMIPPHAMAGAGGQQSNEAKPDTKRIAVPSVKNGAPVQGRFTTPPSAPVSKKVEGKPLATRRIALPTDAKPEGDDPRS